MARRRAKAAARSLFRKYLGAGKDFILIDNRTSEFSRFTRNVDFIKGICDRRNGVGADGLVVLSHHPKDKFKMKFYSCDGRGKLTCGNAMLCAVDFAKDLGLLEYNEIHFTTEDGPHFAIFDQINNRVHIKMAPIYEVIEHDIENYFLDTGVPHHVRFVETLDDFDIEKEALNIKNVQSFKLSAPYPPDVNLHFVDIREDGHLHIRSYEHGLEDESLACGAGAVAAAIALATKACKQLIPAHSIENVKGVHKVSKTEMTLNSSGSSLGDSGQGHDDNEDDGAYDPQEEIDKPVETLKFCRVFCKGARLGVYFTQCENMGKVCFEDIYLVGPTEMVFEGEYKIPKAFLSSNSKNGI